MIQTEFLLELVLLAVFLVFYNVVTKKRMVDNITINVGQQASLTAPTEGRGSSKKLSVPHRGVLDSGGSLGSRVLKLGMRIVDRAQIEGITSEASELSETMNDCIKRGHVARALEVFDQMLEKGTAPDAHLISKSISDKFFKLILEQIPANRLREDGLRLLDLIRAHGLSPSIPTQNRLAVAWKSKLPDDVLHYFMQMKSEGVVIARIVYHCILMAFERSDPKLTLKTFEEMEILGLKPDGVAYNAVLGACCQLGMHEEARHLFMQMADRELVPDRKSYGVMVKVYATSNQAKAAVALIETMRERGFDPDRWTYHYAIVSCFNLQRVEHAVEMYNDMVQANVVPCDGTCRYMRAACQNFGLTFE